MASLMLTAIFAAPQATYNSDDIDDFNGVDLFTIQKKADRAIQGVRDLTQGRLNSKELKSKIEEIAAEIIEEKIAEALAEFVANYNPVVPEQLETTEQPAPAFTTTTEASEVNVTQPSYFPVRNETVDAIGIGGDVS